MRKFSVSFLLMVSLLLAIAPARAEISKLTVSDVTTQYMTLYAHADNPFIEITVVDIQTKQVIGKASNFADKNGEFSSYVPFSVPLGAKGDLDLIFVETNGSQQRNQTLYRVIYNCFTQATPSNPDPCNWIVYSAGVGGDTMSPGH